MRIGTPIHRQYRWNGIPAKNGRQRTHPETKAVPYTLHFHGVKFNRFLARPEDWIFLGWRCVGSGFCDHLTRYTEHVAVRMTVSLDSNVVEWARQRANRENTSLSKLIARLLERQKAEEDNEQR